MHSGSLPVLNNKNTTKRKKLPWYKNPKVWRHATMAVFFVFLLQVAHKHLDKGGGPNGSPSIEAYCPFGGLESLYQFITTGGFIRRIEPSTMILFFAVLILTLLFSRGFCGWICPFGSIQEWIGMIGKKIFGKSYNPTGAWDRYLRYLKYVILVVIIALTWWSGTLVFRDYDPFLAFFHLGQDIGEKAWGYGILLAVLAGSLFIERFFCKYACPLGAVLGIVGKFGLTKVRRDTEGCKECNLCYQKCHAHVDFLSTEEIRTAECNHCLDCVVDCPKPNVLNVVVTKWRFSHPTYAAALLVGLLGMVGVSKATFIWQTQPENVVVRNADGELDAANVRGWMSLNTISQHYEMPVERLIADSGLPSFVSPDIPIKEIHGEYDIEFEPDGIRDVVAAYLAGEPSQARPAASRPAAESAPSDHRPAGSKGTAQGRGPGAEGSGPGRQGQGPGQGPDANKGEGATDEDHEPPVVRGNSTINEIVLKTGIPKAELLKAAGLPDDVPSREPLRDWMRDYDTSPRELRQIVDKLREQRR